MLLGLFVTGNILEHRLGLAMLCDHHGALFRSASERMISTIELCDDLLIDILPAQVAQRLDHQPTDLPRGGHIAGRRALQNDLALASLDSPRTAIR